MNMATYEATYIVNVNVGEADLATTIEKYQTQVAAHGEIVNLDNWGRRRLAYEIDGKREGTYVTMRFKAEPAVAAELERTLKIADNIVRTLIIRVN
jgi:small subunit ribosomal protein S6